MQYGMEKPMRQIVSRAATPRAMKLALKVAACAGTLALMSTMASAQQLTADEATRMYNRIAGIPPSAAELSQMLSNT